MDYFARNENKSEKRVFVHLVSNDYYESIHFAKLCANAKMSECYYIDTLLIVLFWYIVMI